MGNDEKPIDARLWHVPAADTKGHSVKKSFRITPQMEMQIEMVLGSKKFPYRTEGELLRHALAAHLSDLERRDPPPNSLMPQILAILEVTRREESQREFQEVIDKVVREVNNLITSGSKDKAEELMNTIIAESEKIPDEYWRGKYREELARRLAHVKKGRVGGTLHLVNFAKAQGKE